MYACVRWEHEYEGRFQALLAQRTKKKNGTREGTLMGLFASNDCVGTPPMYHSPNERFIECILSVNGLKLPESPADGYSALVGMGLHMGEKSTRVEVDYLLYNLYFEVV